MTDLAAARLQTVRDHMALECVGDWDAVIATFEHPRYELYGTGRVFDGEAAVRGYFVASRTPFPWQEQRGMRACLAARQHGALLRPLGDVVVIMPPLSITLDELDQLCEATQLGIQDATARAADHASSIHA